MKADRKLLKEFCRYINIHCEGWWSYRQKQIHGCLSHKTLEQKQNALAYLSREIKYLIDEFNDPYIAKVYKSQPGTINKSDANIIINKLWKELFSSGEII